MGMEPIGYLHSCFKDKFATPRQSMVSPSACSYLDILAKWQPEISLEGIDEFSHLWLIFQFHLNSNKGFRGMIQPPRLKGKKQGVFATRSPHHPNSLGLSLVRLEKREGSRLYLSGADLVDGTPIFDIKPYLKETESIADAKSGWTEAINDEALSIHISPTAEAQIRKWEEQSGQPLRNLILEILKEDPRPLHQRGTLNKGHVFRLFDCEIHFHFVSDSEIEVLSIQTFSPETSTKKEV